MLVYELKVPVGDRRLELLQYLHVVGELTLLFRDGLLARDHLALQGEPVDEHSDARQRQGDYHEISPVAEETRYCSVEHDKDLHGYASKVSPRAGGGPCTEPKGPTDQDRPTR